MITDRSEKMHPQEPARLPWLLIAAWLVSSWSFFWMIGWGTPRDSWARLVESYEPVATSELAQTRAEIQKSESASWERTGAGSVFGQANAVGPESRRQASSQFTRTEHVDTVQGYLLGAKGYDEAATIAAIQRMATKGKYFDPRDYRYGGAHLYLVAASLAAGTVLGLVPRRVDFEELRKDERPIRRLYIFARLPSAIAMAAALAAMLWVVYRQFGLFPALYSALLISCSPLVINFTHNLKPPAVNAAYVTGILATVWLAKRTKREGWLVGSGIFTGLAVGSYFPSGPILLLPCLYLMVGSSPGWRQRIGKVSKLVLLPAALAFVLSNPFVLTNPSGFAETFSDVTVAKSDYYSLNAGLQNLVDLCAALLQGLGAAISVLSVTGLVYSFRAGSGFDRAVAATVIVGLGAFTLFFGGAIKDPMLGGVSRYVLYLLAPLVYLSCVAIAHLSDAITRRSWVIVLCVLLLTPGLATTVESFAGLRLELQDHAESQVARYLDQNDLRGQRGAIALAVPRPPRHVAFPTLGIDWHRFGKREQWTDDELPDLLLLSHPLSWFEWTSSAKYQREAVFGVDRSRFHRWFSFPCKWFTETYLYTRAS